MNVAAAGLPAVLVQTGRGSSPKAMDERQFEAFYRKSASSLWGYLHRMTGDPSVADDLLQKTFIRFIQANPAVSSEEHMRRYLYRTATTVGLDHFREAKRRATLDDAGPVQTRADGADLRHDMRRVFAELKPRERALLWLAHVEESNHEEIASALGLRPKSVKVLLFRARQKLAELLTRRGIGPEALR